MLSKPACLAIVDDHILFRKTLREYLLDQDNINVVVQASDIPDLLNKLKATSVDILLMDIMVPGVNGKDAVTVIRNEYPSIRILMLSTYTDISLISDLLDSGIHGYISKSDEPEELLQAIQALSEDRIYRNKLFTEALYWNKQNRINVKPCHKGVMINLSERERRILNLIWEEKSNKEIAEEFFLGVRSIEKIRQDMKDKIAVKSTMGLIKYAINKRIIGVGVKSSI